MLQIMRLGVHVEARLNTVFYHNLYASYYYFELYLGLKYGFWLVLTFKQVSREQSNSKMQISIVVGKKTI